VGVTHLAFDFRARHECRNRVDDDEVDGTRTHEHVGDFEGLFTRVGLRDEKLVDVDTERLGVFRVEGVFRVDERGDSAGRLNVGDGVKCEGRLSLRFRAVDFDDATPGQPTDAEGDIEGDGSGRNNGNLRAFFRAEAHDRALAELTVNLCECCFQRFIAVCGCSHGVSLCSGLLPICCLSPASR